MPRLIINVENAKERYEAGESLMVISKDFNCTEKEAQIFALKYFKNLGLHVSEAEFIKFSQ